MANICMDTVVFYTEDDKNIEGLQLMKNAIAACFPIERHYFESNMSKLFTFLDIPAEGLHLRGDIIFYTLEDSFILLECDAAWQPMKDAYDALCNYFDLKMVFTAEEQGNEIYFNTDDERFYLELSYKVLLLDKPSDGSLERLFNSSDGDTDFNFTSESELLQWFRERGHISATTINELMKLVNADYVNIYTYTNPY